MNIIISQTAADDGRETDIVVSDEHLPGLGFYTVCQEYDGIDIKPENMPALIEALQRLIA